MKTKITSSLILALFVTFSTYAQQESQKILGAWKLISLKQGDKIINISPEDSIQRIKYITQSNFVWIQYLKKTKIVRNSAGGSYTYDGVTYKEKVLFAGFGSIDFLNRLHTFNVKIVDNLLYQTGNLYSSTSDSVKIDEIWKRIDDTKESQMAKIEPIH